MQGLYSHRYYVWYNTLTVSESVEVSVTVNSVDIWQLVWPSVNTWQLLDITGTTFGNWESLSLPLTLYWIRKAWKTSKCCNNWLRWLWQWRIELIVNCLVVITSNIMWFPQLEFGHTLCFAQKGLLRQWGVYLWLSLKCLWCGLV